MKLWIEDDVVFQGKVIFQRVYGKPLSRKGHWRRRAKRVKRERKDSGGILQVKKERKKVQKKKNSVYASSIKASSPTTRKGV